MVAMSTGLYQLIEYCSGELRNTFLPLAFVAKLTFLSMFLSRMKATKWLFLHPCPLFFEVLLPCCFIPTCALQFLAVMSRAQPSV